MEIGRQAYLDARDRALDGVVTAKDFGAAQAIWRLAKAHNRCAKENYRGDTARLESQNRVAAGRALATGEAGARDGVGT